MEKSRVVIATIKSWNIYNANEFIRKHSEYEVMLMTEKKEFSFNRIVEFDPQFIFFPHWSWMIPEEIYGRYRCVVFHMTDLPFGRGGSPLQNLLSRGIYQTKISAISVTGDLDAGDIYCKEDIDISDGCADEIFNKVSEIVFEKMIPRIIEEELEPKAQEGDVTIFSRRTPRQSEIPDGLTQRQLYDHIRMLDGEGYPPAFIIRGDDRIVFRNARMIDGHVIAEATFE